MNEDMTHAQLLALMKTLRTEAKNREAGILAMRETIQSERTGVADKLGGTAPAANVSDADNALINKYLRK